MDFSQLQLVPKEFFQGDTYELASKVLGMYLVKEFGHARIVSRIVELECYTSNDPASHSFRGITPRNSVMFDSGGIAYVYFIYGMYYCFNIVTDKFGVGGALLIRALEPISGIDIMLNNRKMSGLEQLSNGPGKLCIALDINKKDNGKDLNCSDIKIYKSKTAENMEIVQTKRIGIKVGTELNYRFYIKGNKYVSKK